VTAGSSAEQVDIALAKVPVACVVVDSRLVGDGAQAAARLGHWRELLSDGGIIVASEPITEAGSAFDLSKFDSLARSGKLIALSSSVCVFDWRRLWVSERGSSGDGVKPASRGEVNQPMQHR
jgi:hypothetical protein